MATVLAQMHDRWGYRDDGFGWGRAVIGLLMIVALVLVIVWAVIAITRSNRAAAVPPAAAGPAAPSAAVPPGNRAKDILAERYARGEIDTEEYQERLAQLG